MKAPPLLPEETFRRVIRLARLDGLTVLALGSFFALLSGGMGDFAGAIIGLLVAGAGAVELHGISLLQHFERRGVNWLVGSQLFLIVAILAYCGMRLTHFTIPPLPDEVMPLIDASAAQFDMTREGYLRFIYQLSYTLVAIGTLAYQGGMAIYYHRRRGAVAKALGPDEVEGA